MSSSSSTTCIATTNGGGGNYSTCQTTHTGTATSLPPLPPIIRGDKGIYFEQRLNLSPLPSSPLDSNHNISNESISSNDENEKNEKNRNRKKLPKQWMMEKEQNHESKFDNDIPISTECRLYMAPSSIPNSGLGMYLFIHVSHTI